MKKRIIIMLLMLSMLFCVTAYADSDIEIYLFGNKVECDVAPVIENGRTLVPVRVISEEGLGADVEWDGEKRQVTIEKDGLSVLLTIDDKKAVVNGETKTLDVPAVIISDRTMVPVRFVSETFNYKVDWDGDKRRVIIEEEEKEKPVEIEDIEYEEKKNNDTIYITLSEYMEPDIFTLKEPYRIVIDFKEAEYDGADERYDIDSPYVKQFRHAANKGYYRFVVECKGEQPYKFKKIDDDEISIIIGTSKTKVESEEDDDISADESEKDEADEDTGDNEDGDEEEPFVLNPDMTVVIDAGHGGKDPGALGRDDEGNIIYDEDDVEQEDPLIKEKDINLAVAKRVYEYLKDEGVDAVMVRSTDEFVELKDIADKANKKDAVLFISIHCNSVDGISTAEGVEVLYFDKESDEKYNMHSKEFADNVLDEIVNSVDTVDRGLKERPGLAVLKWTEMPAVLVELGFITNSADQERLLSVAWQKDVAKAIGDGVIKTLADME